MQKKIIKFGITFIILCLLVVISKKIFKFNIPFVKLSRETTLLNSGSVSFAIGIYAGNDPFQLHETGSIINPVISAGDITDIEATFVADPFMVHAKNKWFMFFEVMNKKNDQGDIGLATSMDGIEWQYQQIVLDESFHLSYPNVFKVGDKFYMIPETNEEKSVRLYEAMNFPLDWEYKTTLLTGLHFTDPTIFEYDGRYWLFIETNPKSDGTLNLYYSDTIWGPWREHPKSPVIEDNENIARPAGRVLFYKDKMIRVAQDDWPTYGNKVRFFQIDKLTTTDYLEHELCDYPSLEVRAKNAEPAIPIWRFDGYHHFDAHKIDENNWIACIDGVTRTSAYNEFVLKFYIPFTKKILQ